MTKETNVTKERKRFLVSVYFLIQKCTTIFMHAVFRNGSDDHFIQ